MNNAPTLPSSVQEIADVIGREAALLLVKSLPRTYSPSDAGRRGASGRVIVYVPSTLRPDHVLVRLLGWDLASRLAAHFGGEILRPADCATLDRAERNAAMRALKAAGMPTAEIAREFRVSDRTVRLVVQEIPEVAANDNAPETHPSVITA